MIDRLLSRAIRHADRHAAVSSDAAQLLEQEFGAQGVSVMPSCVDMPQFENASSERETIREKLGVSENDVLVIYAGGSQEYQMLPQMFRMWERMADDSSVHFLALMHGADSGELGSRLPGE